MPPPGASPIPGTVVVPPAPAPPRRRRRTVPQPRRRHRPPTAPPATRNRAPAAATPLPQRRRRATGRPMTSPGVGVGAGHHLAAGDADARGRRAVHDPDVDHRRVASLDRHADAGLRPGEAAGAQGAGRQFHAERAARTSRSRSRSDEQPHRHHDRARSADATGASGTGLLAAVLFDAIAPGDVRR